MAAAYRVKTLAKLVVWDTATFRVVRDTKIKFVNEDTDFGLQAAFHPDGAHVLTFGQWQVEGLPLGSATNRLLVRTRIGETRDRLLNDVRSLTFWVSERSIKSVTVCRDNTLFVDAIRPDQMRFNSKNATDSLKSFTSEKRFLLEARPALLAMDPEQTKVVWAHAQRA